MVVVVVVVVGSSDAVKSPTNHREDVPPVSGEGVDDEPSILSWRQRRGSRQRDNRDKGDVAAATTWTTTWTPFVRGGGRRGRPPSHSTISFLWFQS